METEFSKQEKIVQEELFEAIQSQGVALCRCHQCNNIIVFSETEMTKRMSRPERICCSKSCNGKLSRKKNNGLPRITEAEIDRLIHAGIHGILQGPLVSLDLPVGEDGEQTIVDFIPSNNPSPVAVVSGIERKVAVERMISILPERQRNIIQWRFGLKPMIDIESPSQENNPQDDKEHTLSEIGFVLGLSREWVRQLENLAMEKMRKWVFNGNKKGQRKAYYRDLMLG
jgi:hypothetical protein